MGSGSSRPHHHQPLPRHTLQPTTRELSELSDKIAGLLEKGGASKSEQDVADVADLTRLGVGFGVLEGLFDCFKDLGPYGLLFKIGCLIKQRLDTMSGVQAKAAEVLEEVDTILKLYEKMEITFYKDSSIAGKATATFIFCIQVLERIRPRRTHATSGGPRLAHKMKRFAAGDEDNELLEKCLRKLQYLTRTLQLDSLCPQALPQPYMDDEDPAIGVEEQCTNILDFLDRQKEKVAVVYFYGLKGVGKSRLMREVMHRKFLEPPICLDMSAVGQTLSQQKALIQQLSGDPLVTASLADPEVGKQLILDYTECWRRLGRTGVLLALDNISTAEQLTDLLPARLSNQLPASSCILISVEGHVPDAESPIYTAVDNIFSGGQRTVATLCHPVSPLGPDKATELFSRFAQIPSDGDPFLVKDLVARCNGLPAFLRLTGQAFTSSSTWEDWEAVQCELTKEPIEQDLQVLRSLVASITKRSVQDRKFGMAKLVYKNKLQDPQLRDAFEDIANLFHGWDGRTVESILGRDVMATLTSQGLISSKTATHAQSLAGIAQHTRLSTPGPWKINLVDAVGELRELAVDANKEMHVEKVDKDLEAGLTESFTLRRSLCLANCINLQGYMLDKLQGLCHVVLHETVMNGKIIKPLDQLKFLYWGFDDSRDLGLPFESSVLRGVQILFLRNINNTRGNLQIPPQLLRLILANCTNILEALVNLTNLQDLTFIDCKEDLKTLPSLLRYDKLKRLRLERCGEIRALDTGSLQNLEELELLSCEGLQRYSGSGCKALKTLHIVNCQTLTELHVDEGSINLTEINLTRCISLQSLPKETGGFLSMQRLCLVACWSLQTVPDEVTKLSKLEQLELDFCSQLTSLPDRIYNLGQLNRLTLGACTSLKELPGGTSRLNNLQLLNLIGSSVQLKPKQLENLLGNGTTVLQQESDLRHAPKSSRQFHSEGPGNQKAKEEQDRRKFATAGTRY